MKLKGSYLAVLLTFGLLLGGAGSAVAAPGGTASVPTVNSLSGKKYTSVKLTGSPVVKGLKLRIVFSKSSSKPGIRIHGGCNVWFAPIEIRNGRIKGGPASGTKIGCQRDPDQWLQRKFRKGMKVRVHGNRLIFSRPAERVRFVFKPVGKSKRVIDEPGPDLSIPVGDPATVETLEGKTFESVKVIGEQVNETIELSFEKGRLGAYLGCNRMSGDYLIGLSSEDWQQDGQLSWSNVLTTDMLCPLGKDSWFSGLLDTGVKATVKDSWLVLTRGKTTIVLKQVAISDPPERVPAGEPSTVESLAGRSFESVSIIGRRLVKPIEISFTDNGLGAYLGCNWMGGEYMLEDGQLRWLDVVSTLIGCYGGGNERDSWFENLLEDGVDVSESGDGLIFDGGSTQIVFREVPSNQVSEKIGR